MALKRPFTASNMKGLMAKVNAGEYPPLPDKYIKEGLKVLLDTIKKNSRITAEVKQGFEEHISLVLSGASDSNTGTRSRAVGQINKDVAHEGMVRKLGGVMGKAWKDRWLMLQRGHLIICDKQGDDASGKALSLEQVQSVCPVPASTAKRDFVFALNTN